MGLMPRAIGMMKAILILRYSFETVKKRRSERFISGFPLSVMITL